MRSVEEVPRIKDRLYSKFQEISNQGYGVVIEKLQAINSLQEEAIKIGHTGLFQKDQKIT